MCMRKPILKAREVYSLVNAYITCAAYFKAPMRLFCDTIGPVVPGVDDSDVANLGVERTNPRPLLTGSSL